MENIRFNYKAELVQINGGVATTLYTDFLQVINALKTINTPEIKEVIVYEETKNGLDWKEIQRFDVTFNDKKVKKEKH